MTSTRYHRKELIFAWVVENLRLAYEIRSENVVVRMLSSELVSHDKRASHQNDPCIESRRDEACPRMLFSLVVIENKMRDDPNIFRSLLIARLGTKHLGPGRQRPPSPRATPGSRRWCSYECRKELTVRTATPKDLTMDSTKLQCHERMHGERQWNVRG